MFLWPTKSVHNQFLLDIIKTLFSHLPPVSCLLLWTSSCIRHKETHPDQNRIWQCYVRTVYNVSNVSKAQQSVMDWGRRAGLEPLEEEAALCLTLPRQWPGNVWQSVSPTWGWCDCDHCNVSLSLSPLSPRIIEILSSPHQVAAYCRQITGSSPCCHAII